MTVSEQKNFLIKFSFYSILIALAYVLLKLASGPLLPFLLAAALAVCLQGVIRRLCEKFRFKKGFAAVATVVAVYLTVGVLAVWLVRALYRQLTELVAAIPQYSQSISDAFEGLQEKLSSFFGEMPDIGNGLFADIPTAALTTVAEKATAFLTDFAANFAQGVPTFLLSLAVTVIASAYFTKDYGKIVEYFTQGVPESSIKKLIFIRDIVLNKLGKLLKGYAVIMAMTFLELLVGLWLLDVKYALIIALLTALVDILPVLGSGTVLVPWAAVSALGGSPVRAAGLIALYIVITAVRNITEPKIIGSRLGVHPLLMLAAVFLGLRLFGGMGVIIAPIAVIVIKTLFERPQNTPA